MLAFLFSLALASATDDSFTMSTYRCEPGGWRLTAPAGWVLTPRSSDTPATDVAVNATKSGVKGNIVIAWHKGATLASNKAKLDAVAKTHVVKKPTIDKANTRLRAEFDSDAQGQTAKSYEVAVAGAADQVVEIAITVGPAADFADLKSAADTFADALVFEAAAEKPWAHKKNVELLTGTLCASKTESLAFDGTGHLVVQPGNAKTWYELVGDDAKVAVPSKAAVPTEIACTASARAADGHVQELTCGKTKWRADRCTAP
ncbi:MAG TPA: hypothetical protein VGO62_22275 [Myxococcota bacterium]|jgi:hypothetical protein